MIKYNLKCQNDHEFESWFSDSEEFEKLNKKRLLECIYCNSKRIDKSIMSPMVSSPKNTKDLSEKENAFKNEKTKLLFLRKYIESNFDFVGKDLTKKVREFYYDKKRKKVFMELQLRRARRISRGRY